MLQRELKYAGYAKLPKKDVYEEVFHLDFNGHIRGDMTSGKNISKMEGFSLRLFAHREGKKEELEVAITMRPEQWLDLIDAMKEEFEMISKLRKEFENPE